MHFMRCSWLRWPESSTIFPHKKSMARAFKHGLILSQPPISHHVYCIHLPSRNQTWFAGKSTIQIDEFPIKKKTHLSDFELFGYQKGFMSYSSHVACCSTPPPCPSANFGQLLPTLATGSRLTWGKDRLICSKLACNRSSYMGSMDINGPYASICGMVIPPSFMT